MANTKAEFRQNLISLGEIIDATRGLSDKFQNDYFDLKFDLAQTADSNDGLGDRVEVLEVKVTTLEDEVLILQIDVSALDVRVTQNEATISSHITSNSQHGVTGDNVGTDDFCTATAGLLYLVTW